MMFQYIEDEFVYDYETYEQFPVVDRFFELDSLVDAIPVADRMSVLTSLAISYINMGLIYANSHLQNAEMANYLIFGVIDYDKDDFEEFGFCIPEVFFTRKANEWHFDKSELIVIQENPLYDKISQVIGVDDFYWYYCDGCYYFFPKLLKETLSI